MTTEPPQPLHRSVTSENHRGSQEIHENTTSHAEKARPSVAKLWQTERPPPATRISLISPNLTRRITNASALNEAIWNTHDSDGNDDSSEAESSSSEEEESPHPKRKAAGRIGRGRKPDQNQGPKKGAYSRFAVGNEDYKTRGRVSKRDGRLNISVNETNNRGYLVKALGANFLQNVGGMNTSDSVNEKRSRSSSSSTLVSDGPLPALNIVVMVIGSRGDIQPFLKLGKDLKEYGHRVRIATHPAFKEFVENDSGLEFFSVGGDPAELMAFMVKNPGMIPTMETLKKGEVGRRRAQMAEMFDGFWRACINATDDEKDVSNLKMLGANSPFVADAIIANPPSFAHVHCAERLGIPLHLMFTFPYTPTQSFPHPLANIKRSNIDPGYTNFMSYPLVEMMTWQGLGDLVNDFRVKTLGLEPVSTLWAPGQLYRLKVPYTYLWSPGLVPKPKDWGPEIDIAGFVFLDLASSFEPPSELMKFLEAGDPPVYIGFGSIVVDDPDKFTAMIFEAVEKAGVRALVSKGWGGLGDDNVPDNIFMLENTPHDWLFPKVKAVVHHGGAGTTAIGLKCGKPTMVVPFFGDQQFWGAMIAEAGAGAEPVPYKKLDSDKLAEGIKTLLTDRCKEEAEKIASSIEAEGDGAKNAVASFHRSLVLRGPRSIRCSILEDRVAVWTLKDVNLRLSALAAELLVEKKRISWKQLRLVRHNEWNDFEGPGEPLTGVGTALLGTVTGVAAGVGSVPFRLAKSAKRRAKHQEKKTKKIDAAKERQNGSGSSPKEDGETSAPSKTVSSHPDKENVSPNQQDSPVRNGETQSILNVVKLDSPDISKSTTASKSRTDQDTNRTAESIADTSSILSAEPEETTAEEIVQDVGGGVRQTLEAAALAPLDLSLAVAQGFHNAPRLYGDQTVRRPTRITGMKSGLKAAGEEFTYGVYDGVTGLVTQPYHGAREQGAVGFVKGVGMGFTGFILKDLAAILGPFAYTAKGVHKQFTKHKQPTNFIRKARIRQGQRDIQYCSEEERRKAKEMVNHGWSVIQDFWILMDQKHGKKILARASARKERNDWKASGAFENVRMAEKALEAVKNGQTLESVFAIQKKELAAAGRQKTNVIDNVGEGDIPEDKAPKILEIDSGIQNQKQGVAA